MNDWDEGYVSDHSYGNYYFGQLSPSFLKGLLCLSGYNPPQKAKGHPLRYLELGFGQGLSLNIHAAIDQETEFWGTDFLPEQVLNAKQLAKEANLGTHILNYSFAEFENICYQGQVPSFDMIILHGIWSWINEENRQHLLRIIRKILRPKGFVYLSYNAFPGQTLLLPMRKLMMLYAERKIKEKDSLVRAKFAAQFVNNLSKANATFFSENNLIKKIKSISEKDPTYIAHEYLNRDWDNFYFTDVALSMNQIGCSYAISARHLDSFSFAHAPDTLDFIYEITNPIAKESLRDFNLYQGFRSDIYIKDNEPLSESEYNKNIQHCFFALMSPLNQIQLPLSVELTHFQGKLETELYFPILSVLAENNYAPKNLEIIQSRLPSLSFAQLVFCMNVLVGSFYVAIATPSPSKKSVAACKRLNRLLCEKTKNRNTQKYLASPTLGCGLNIPEYVQLLLLSYSSCHHDEKTLLNDLKQMMSHKNFRIQLDNQIIEGEKAFSIAVEQFIKEFSFYETVGLVF